MLRLSIGEEQAAAAAAAAEQRRRRLQAVRTQARQIARRKAEAYQAGARDEWARARRHADDAWRGAKDDALAAAAAAVDATALCFGLAHAHAACLADALDEQDRDLEARVLLAQKTDAERGSHALHEFRHETMKRLEPHKTHIQTLKSIHETETARAKELAEKYRVQQSKYSPNVTPISQPIQKMNLIQQQRSLKAGNIKYDYSQHHRNYAVVRLEADIENRPKPVDAAEAAPKASETAHVRLNNSETRARLHKVTAEARFHRAVTAKTMDTKKDVLCRELDALRLEDCQRKYRTAGGGPSGLAARRVNFVALNEAGKKEQFTKRFGIGDEPTFSLENAKTREYLRKEYGLGRIENESVADSIEFSRSNSPLQLNSNLERK